MAQAQQNKQDSPYHLTGFKKAYRLLPLQTKDFSVDEIYDTYEELQTEIEELVDQYAPELDLQTDGWLELLNGELNQTVQSREQALELEEREYSPNDGTFTIQTENGELDIQLQYSPKGQTRHTSSGRSYNLDNGRIEAQADLDRELPLELAEQVQKAVHKIIGKPSHLRPPPSY